jgi:hypothetical protein
MVNISKHLKLAVIGVAAVAGALTASAASADAGPGPCICNHLPCPCALTGMMCAKPVLLRYCPIPFFPEEF